LPDDVGNVELAQSGYAWFSSVVGAVRHGDSQSVTFGEARGVRGEVVSDVLLGVGNRVWVAAAEGPGYYFRQSFEFRMPQAVRAARPLALALDPNGDVWGARHFVRGRGVGSGRNALGAEHGSRLDREPGPPDRGLIRNRRVGGSAAEDPSADRATWCARGRRASRRHSAASRTRVTASGR
ncbi:MAG: hypothetical protein MUE69_31195, partial [Myxococcota bacterium]|nr:hypothetical protein [Myxococcota bacterium]